ncbi:serine O-acetyltransferase [Oleomonas cavernae]|uniref:Serine acetyltransferase n=1 Tax=Oleomonas cavernae TaxID=2320859 RepID=A0A418WA47_9PROT|nr:serine O-acetyltransferase [Oleomonas cavernae]RJF86885.1 serine O-acetyltransferase [Oleomonas cavernae]
MQRSSSKRVAGSPALKTPLLRGVPDIWQALREHAETIIVNEPLLAGPVQRRILNHDRFEDALASMLSVKVASESLGSAALRGLIGQAQADDPTLAVSSRADLSAVVERDPAVKGPAHPFLFFKGYQALQLHRIAHHLWLDGRRDLALFLQSRASEVFGVDIHPAAPIGRGVMLDHATALVVGETAVIGNNVSILQKVTLGGTGKESGDRHPKIRDGVLLAAGAIVLGNIVVGTNAKVAAGSVVLEDVPPCATVAGVPARIVGWCKESVPALAMNQALPPASFPLPDNLPEDHSWSV